MKKNCQKNLLLIALFFYFPLSSMAWGVLGHRIVGQIADSYISPKAKIALQNILGNESIAMASNWPDFIKSDSSYNYLSTWHYINFNEGLSYDSMKNYLLTDTNTNAFTKINFIVKELKKKQLTQAQKILYVRLLIHLVGDIHQPLHVGKEEDQGGNKIKVTWFGASTNMHTVWDTHLINFQQLSYSEYAKSINFTTKKMVTTWQQQPLSSWLFESYKIAEKIYADASTQPDEKLGYLYNFKYVATVNEQLLKAGVRLAGLFNEIFKA
jgi:S1/P1 Nuclease